jgi:hypothetical protein
MYFPKTKTLLQQEGSLTSLEEEEDLLRLFKQHCALPDDPDWVERDALLGMYLDAAEAWIDHHTGTTFRAKEFTLKLERTVCFNDYHAIRLPVRPIDEVSFEWTDDNGDTGTFSDTTDYLLAGKETLTPEIIFLPDSTFTDISVENVPYPFVINITTLPDPNLSHKLCILQLASYYYKNPEAMGETIPNMSQAFFSVLNGIAGSLL